jgi:transcriptional pleiotropic repressor
MMDGIVEKIRSLNMVFGKSATTVIPLDALCQKLCKILGCNIYLFDNAGHIFACAVAPAFLCPYIECSLLEKELPGYYMERFNSQDQSIVGLYEENPKCTYGDVGRCTFQNRYYSIYPIFSMFKKTAGILFIRYEDQFSEADKVLCEYTCAIVSIEMLRQEQERAAALSSQAAKAKVTVESLSFSEKKASRAIMREIDWKCGEVFLNAIASQTYTAPSTVSGALKKLELATLIHTRSRGVKGMYVEVRNPNLRTELDKFERNLHP